MGVSRHNGGRSALLSKSPEQVDLNAASPIRWELLSQLTRWRTLARLKRMEVRDPLVRDAILCDAQTEAWVLLTTKPEYATRPDGTLRHTDRWISGIAIRRAFTSNIAGDSGDCAIPPDVKCPRAGQAALAVEIGEVIEKLPARSRVIALTLLAGGSYRDAAAHAGCSTQTVFADVQRMAVSFA